MLPRKRNGTDLGWTVVVVIGGYSERHGRDFPYQNDHQMRQCGRVWAKLSSRELVLTGLSCMHPPGRTSILAFLLTRHVQSWLEQPRLGQVECGVPHFCRVPSYLRGHGCCCGSGMFIRFAVPLTCAISALVCSMLGVNERAHTQLPTKVRLERDLNSHWCDGALQGLTIELLNPAQRVEYNAMMGMLGAGNLVCEAIRVFFLSAFSKRPDGIWVYLG